MIDRVTGVRRAAVLWRRSAVLFLVVGAAALAASGGARSAFPGRAGLVVSAVSAGVQPQVVEVDAVRGTLETERPAPELGADSSSFPGPFAIWSPDGGRVAVVRWEEGTPATGPVAQQVIYVDTSEGQGLRFVAVGSEPAWSPDGRRLAFFRDVFKGAGVFVADLASGTVRRIARGGGPPAWSADGKRVVYGTSRLGSGRPGLWSVAASGGKPRPLVRSASVSEAPACSPAGDRVAFVDDRKSTLTLLNLRTRHTRAIARSASQPVWSPHGHSLAYLRPSARPGGLHVVRADGSHDRKVAIAIDRVGLRYRPLFAWSPDGSQIAAVGYFRLSAVRVADGGVRVLLGGGWSSFSGISWVGMRRLLVAGLEEVKQIAVTAPDGSGRHFLTRGSSADIDPVWSAEGTQIAFASDRDGDYELYVMRADGSEVHKVTNNHDEDTSPSWSPDSTRLAFNRSGGIWTIGADGTDERPFAQAPVATWFPPLWSTDGRFIAYNRCDSPPPSYACPDAVIGPADTTAAGCNVPVVGPGYAAVEWSRDAALLQLRAMKGGFTATVDTHCGNWQQPFDPDPSHWAPDGRSVRTAAGDWQALCTIAGREAADTIVGSDGDDVICGFGGDDHIDGRGGHDVIYGGPGNDTLSGGTLNDWLFGGYGNDTLDARDGAPDIVNGGPGMNAAFADATDDVVHAERQAAR